MTLDWDEQYRQLDLHWAIEDAEDELALQISPFVPFRFWRAHVWTPTLMGNWLCAACPRTMRNIYAPIVPIVPYAPDPGRDCTGTMCLA